MKEVCVMQDGNAAFKHQSAINLTLFMSGFLFCKYCNTTQHKDSFVEGLINRPELER